MQQIGQFIDIEKGLDQVHSQPQPLRRGDGHVFDGAGTHGDAAKDVVRLPHGNQIIAAVIGRPQDNIGLVKRLLSIGDRPRRICGESEPMMMVFL